MSIAFYLLVMAGFLIYLIYHRNQLPTESNYTKTKDGDWTRFIVTPGRPTIRIYFQVSILGSLVLLFLGLHILGLLSGMLCLWLTFKDMRPRLHRKPSEFRVSSTAIESNGQHFAAEDIHRLIFKNSLDSDYVYLVTDQNAAMQVDKMNDRTRASKMAFALAVEEGGRSHELAGGLNETTANGLLTDTSRLLGFDVQ